MGSSRALQHFLRGVEDGGRRMASTPHKPTKAQAMPSCQNRQNEQIAKPSSLKKIRVYWRPFVVKEENTIPCLKQTSHSPRRHGVRTESEFGVFLFLTEGNEENREERKIFQRKSHTKPRRHEEEHSAAWLQSRKMKGLPRITRISTN